jgi:hypothetical protein
MSLSKSFQIGGAVMANQGTRRGKAMRNELPKIILLESTNDKIDSQKKSDEILYYLTQIILLADKKGRPSKDQISEVQDAA